MNNEKEDEVCPTCGQSMKFLKSEKKSKDSKINEDATEEDFDITQIWHCLNCSEEWKMDIIKNIWRKNEISK